MLSRSSVIYDVPRTLLHKIKLTERRGISPDVRVHPDEKSQGPRTLEVDAKTVQD